MALNLAGLRVAICGGLGGIGREICKGLLEKNVARLAVLDLKEDADALKKWKSEHPKQGMFFGNIDVTKRADVEKSVGEAKKELGGLDMFINCSGILKDNDPDLTIQVNLLGTIYTTLTAVNLMGKQKGQNGGTIVNVASVLGLQPCHQFGIYSASKHGCVGFTRSLSHEFHFNKTGIRFLTICPGITVTNIIADTKDLGTFDYLADEAVRFTQAKTQQADICGKNIIKALETGKNGSVWICDLGTLKEANIPVYWEAQY